jgi:hypothetical protein
MKVARLALTLEAANAWRLQNAEYVARSQAFEQARRAAETAR